MEALIEQNKMQISAAQWLEHYKSWQKTSLSEAEYCRRYHLKIENFYSWCYRFKRKETQDGCNETECFIPILTKDIPENLNDKITMELSLPHDIRVKMSVYPKMVLDVKV